MEDGLLRKLGEEAGELLRCDDTGVGEILELLSDCQ